MKDHVNYFLILENNKLLEIVESEFDEEITFFVLSQMFPGLTVIKNDNETGQLFIKNSEFINGKFYPPKPYGSWIIKDDSWSAPVEYPNDGNLYFWDESKINWIQYTEQFN